MPPFKSYADAVSGGNKKAKVLKSDRPSATNSPAPDSAAMQGLDLGTTEQPGRDAVQVQPSNSNDHSTTQSMVLVAPTEEPADVQASNATCGEAADAVPSNSNDRSTTHSVVPSAPPTQRSNLQAPSSMNAAERYEAELFSLYHNIGVLSEAQRDWCTIELRKARLYVVAGKFFGQSDTLARVLDHLPYQVLVPLRHVAKVWAQTIDPLILNRGAEWRQTGIWRNGSDLEKTCRGMCRWLKESCAKNEEVKRGQGADTPHQEES